MSADCVLLPGRRHQQAAELVERPGAAPPVDAYEVAAALEASGISDRTAAERHGFPDVFALGAELLPELRLQAAVCPAAPTASRVAVIPTLQRALAFVLPALLTGSAMGGHTARIELLLLLAAVAYGWAAGQGVAYAGYALTSAGSAPEARRLMRDLAVLALLPALVGAGLVCWQLPSAAYVLAVAVAQIAYVLASTIGVVLRRPGLMLLAMSPGLLTAIPDLVMGLPRLVVLPGIALSVLGTVVAALLLCRAGRSPSRPVTRAVLADSRLYAAYGAGLALLLTLGLVDGLIAPTPGVGSALMPLVGGVIVAEWQLERYRSRVGLIMQTTTSKAAFAEQIRAALARCVGGYLAVLLVLILAMAWSVDDLQLVMVLRLAATGVLGLAFLAALLLVAHRQVVPVLVVVGAAVVLVAGRYLLRVDAFDLAVGYLAICTSLALTLSTLAWQRLTTVEVHR